MKRGELAKKVLLAAGVSLAIGTMMVVPGFAVVLNDIIKIVREREGKKIGREKVKRVFYNLKKRKLIDLKEIDGELLATFNEQGQKLLLKYKFDELEIPRPKIWDKKWRIVIFDIPEKKKKARDILRNKLKQLGFYQLQKSVFIYPFECQKEIEVISYVYEIQPFVDFIRADYIDKKEEMSKKFEL